MEKIIFEKVINKCLEKGVDYAEIYMENSTHYYMQAMGMEIAKISKSEDYGVGIRTVKDLVESYAYTNDISEDNLLKMVDGLGKSLKKEEIILKEKKTIYNNYISKTREEFTLEDQKNLLLTSTKAMLEYDKCITQAIAVLTEDKKVFTIANSKGVFQNNQECNLRFSCQSVASNGEITQTGNNSYGANAGYEIFDNFDVINFSKDVAKTALTMLNADEMVGGEIPVIIHNGFGGVIFHEACGHSLEASAVAKNLSVFSGKVGDQIASSLVSAVDDATLKGEWGSFNLDDEGNLPKRKILIEKGILKGYMIDEVNSLRMNKESTGSGRRQSYKFMPTSRMSNTFIENGESTFEEIIEKTKYGLFAKSLGGGSVDPSTGEFNFAVLEGYMVESGKITKPVRGASIVGNGKEILKRIDMVGNNLRFGHGICGAASGQIPTNVGQPTIRLTHMTVGGKGE